MTIKEAIKRAIIAGYEPVKILPHTITDVGVLNRTYVNKSIKEMILEPEFWKALAWSMDSQPNYLVLWHDLVDVLNSGKTIEDYFKKL